MIQFASSVDTDGRSRIRTVQTLSLRVDDDGMELAGFFAGSRNTTGSALGNSSLDATGGGAFGSSALGSAADAARRFSRELRNSCWILLDVLVLVKVKMGV